MKTANEGSSGPLGHGGFGEVRLEKNKEDGKARAVKRIATASTNLSNSECEKELRALLEFSKCCTATLFRMPHPCTFS